MSEFQFICEQLKARLLAFDEPVENASRLPEAAVALVLRRFLDQPELLVIKRAQSERDHWSGHLALPGGRRQSTDADLCQTALRETFEEVGIDVASGGQVLGRLHTVRPQSPLAPQIAVTPYVAVAPHGYHVSTEDEKVRPLVLNHEVAAALWMPVAFLQRDGRSEIFRFMVGGVEREWLSYPTKEGPIWGMTERIITDFLKLLDQAHEEKDEG